MNEAIISFPIRGPSIALQWRGAGLRAETPFLAKSPLFPSRFQLNCCLVVHMSWIRKQIRWGAQLALMALAVQMVLTFGHVHLERYLPAGVIAAVENPEQPAGTTSPEHPYRGPLSRDFCAVCSTISLVGALVLPVAHALSPPEAYAHVSNFPFADAEPPPMAWPYPPARGPPFV
jgi:hypothetical protein